MISKKKLIDDFQMPPKSIMPVILCSFAVWECEGAKISSLFHSHTGILAH
jgi:hypothetical protein